jgi:hypothetical protein
MPSVYLEPSEYGLYGAANATAAQVQQASVLMDAFMRRPEGLVYVPDANGAPCYMAAANPGLSLASVGTIAPGSSVAVPVTGPLLALQVGDVVVLDRLANPAELPGAVEACVISAVAGQPSSPLAATLESVQFAHGAGCSMETGLVITEQKFMPKDRTTTILSRVPAVRVIGGTGRYGYGRRGDAGNYNVDDFNLLAALSKFGGPPAWEIWDPANAGLDPMTGELWAPAGVMLAYYSEVKVRYVAGFTYAGLPGEVKLACALTIQAMLMNPMYGNVKNMRAGETSVENFASSNLSEDVKAMLRPWAARTHG